MSCVQFFWQNAIFEIYIFLRACPQEGIGE